MENKSLLQAFEPPEGYFGQVCICCALSADQLFMEDALRHFSKHYDGLPRIYLMLDKTGDMLDANHIPGLIQLQAKNDNKIRIQHAKIALMQFGKNRYITKLKATDDTIWRLVVSTGNWTVASACNNIEMVWKADFLVKEPKNNEQLLADLASACEFFTKLRKRYVCNESLWNRAKTLCECIKEYEKTYNKNENATRFFSTIGGDSLMESIKSRFKDGTKRNFVQIGSGFYEKGTESSKPEIITKIDAFLKSSGLFFNQLTKKIVVNSDNANRLSFWEKKEWDGWKLFNIKDPIQNSERKFMHAKYICIGKMDHDNNLSECKFYIGSGNLTRMGLLSAYGKTANQRGAGNIEAGIVIDVDSQSAKELLSHGGLIRNSDVLSKQDKQEEKKRIIPICPLNAFRLNGHNLDPIWNSKKDLEVTKGFCIIETDAGETKIELFKNKAVPYPKSQPIYVLVKWCDFTYWLPVLTENKTLPLPIINVNSIDDLLEDITEFPNKTDLDDENPPGDENPPDDGGGGPKPPFPHYSQEQQDVFPIQLSMKLVEGIAKRNETITDDFIDDWIETLERHLEALPKERVEELKRMKVNFLNILTKTGFAPLLKNNDSRKKWNNFIKRTSQKWGMNKWIGLK